MNVKNTLKDAVDAMKKAGQEFARAIKGAVKFSASALEDGTQIEYEGDAIVPGTIVYVKDTAGDWVVISDGSHKEKDGKEFKVEGGVVTEVAGETEVVEEVVEEVEAAEDSEDTPAEAEEVKEDDKDFKVDVDTLIDEKLKDVLARLEALEAKLSEGEKADVAAQTAMAAISKVVTELAKAEGAGAISTVVVENEVKPTGSKLPAKYNRLQEIMSAGNKNK